MPDGRSFTDETRSQVPAAKQREHDAKVMRIASAIRRHPAGTPLSLQKKPVSHMVPKLVDPRRVSAKLDIRDLNQILHIDEVARTCVAEPGVTFEALVTATLAHGLVPTVVPELETITIGGAVSGASLESMSFKYGGFHDSCVEYEVVTTAGDVLVCSPEGELSRVFEMIHSSFGTLGVLTKLTFRLVPAKPFVKLTYERYATLAECTAAIREHMLSPSCDFLDGIFHRSDLYVLAVGHFVDHAPYTHKYDWVTVYYETTAKRKEDYLRTKDYFFRYDRGVTNPTPKSWLGRLLVGKWLDSTKLLRIAEWGHKYFLRGKPAVTLDMFIPLSQLAGFMEWYEREIGFFPLWCVPYKVARTYDWVAKGYLDGVAEPELYIDIAIYGLEQPEGRNYYKEIEDALLRFHAVKTLISHNYFEEEQFWRVWNRENYEHVKAITDPRGLFPDLYRKTHA